MITRHRGDVKTGIGGWVSARPKLPRCRSRAWVFAAKFSRNWPKILSCWRAIACTR